MDEYLNFMMGTNPEELSVEQQRAMAQRLRGMNAVGAMGLTSQTTGAAQGGKQLMDAASAIGQTMGDRKQEAGRERNRLVQALARSSGGSGGKQDVWRATQTERKEMKELSSALGTISALNATFKDEYANPGGLGIMEALTRRGMNREPVLTKAILGALGKDTSKLEGEMEWWRQYARLQEIPQLAATYGATLTQNEMTRWESAEIYEGQTPSQIRRNLQIRTELANKWLRDALEFNKRLGFPTEQLERQLDGYEDPGSIEDIMRRNIGGDASQEAIENPSEEDVPQGVDPEEWYSLTPQQRLDFYRYMQ